MDIELFAEMQEDRVVFNQKILDGLAYSDLQDAQQCVDSLIGCAEKSFPSSFEYSGRSTICSPMETYRVMAAMMTRSDRANYSIEMAKTNAYLAKYQFFFEGKPLRPRYFWLPSPRRGGLMDIHSKGFSLSPVLVDPGFSVGEEHVFVRMNRAPVTFRQIKVQMKVDDQLEWCDLAYSLLHWRAGSNNRKSSSDTIALGKVMSTLPHYLFCRYGLKETFAKFARCDVKIFHQDSMEAVAVNMNRDNYVLITTSGQLPASLKMKLDRYLMVKSPMVLAIPKANWNTLTKSFAAAFFYIADHFPEVHDVDELLSSWRWKMWMGCILFGDQQGPVKLVENVETHLNSLDDYVDLDLKRTLLDEEELDIDNIYQLFVHMLNNMGDMIKIKQQDIGSMYGKRLVTAPYILRDIYEQIFKCLFEITNNRKRKHTAEDYNKILAKYFVPTTIFNLRKTSIKPYVSSVSTPGDNMFAKITSRIVLQAQTSAGRKGGNMNVNDPMNHLHHSVGFAGNYMVLPKSTPLGKITSNPTALMDAKNTLMAPTDPELVAISEHIDDAIHRSH